MAFIYDNQKVFGKEIQQTVRSAAWLSSIKVPGVIFYTGAVSQFPEHLHIVCDAFVQSFSFIWLTLFFKESNLLGQIIFNLMNSFQCALFGSHEKIGRIYFIFVKAAGPVSADRIYFFDRIDFIIPKYDTE